MKTLLKFLLTTILFFMVIAILSSKIVYAELKDTYMTDTDMDVTKAWKEYKKINTKKHQVVVAIIDTGVDYTHPDLKDSIWINTNEIPKDGIDNDNNGFIDDIYGWDFSRNTTLSPGTYFKNDNNIHGTHCAGIIASKPNKKLGTIGGIASNISIKILPIKVLKCNGGSIQGNGSTKSAINAIKYAQKMGADICNISWVTSFYDPELEQVMRESNMLFVAAAGNNSSNNNSSLVYPSCFDLDNLISVASVDSDGALSQTSNYGLRTVDIAAPGVDILSTANGGYTKMSGTSMATPHVTAVAAILYSLIESPYPANVKEILINTMKPCSFLEGYIKNSGVVNAYNAVKSYQDLVSDDIPPLLNIKSKISKDKILLTLNPEDIGGSQIRVVKYMYGSKEIEDFAKGTKGTYVNGSYILIKKPGVYTFYISDFSGNENRIIYNVVTDTTKPSIRYSYTIFKHQSKGIVNINVTDKGSGIKAAKVLKGERKLSDFTSGGTIVKLIKEQGTFAFKSLGKYTVFAEDYRGNKTIKVINIQKY